MAAVLHLRRQVILTGFTVESDYFSSSVIFFHQRDEPILFLLLKHNTTRTRYDQKQFNLTVQQQKEELFNNVRRECNL